MIATARQIEMPDSWEDPLASEQAAEKPKFPRELGIEVARELLAVIAPLCEPDRVKVCGSLRRRKAEVGDVEIVFVPRMQTLAAARMNLFNEVEKPALVMPATCALLDDLVARGVLEIRRKRDGSQNSWGKWNRFAVHVESGVPVDFFGCMELSWWNTVVCRTGGARSNTAICMAAQAKGWHWEPSPEAAGFQRRRGLASPEIHAVTSEREVFDFAGVEYREPWERA